MNKEQIREIQEKIGTEVDGFWGPASNRACKDHLRSMMPTKSPFPSGSQSSVKGYYGTPGDVTTIAIKLPFTIYYEGKPVDKLYPHKLCGESLYRIFKRLSEAFPTDKEKRDSGILTYDGLYNPRKMRGGSSWSMHAWAIAIDFDAGRNGNRQHWPTVSEMPIRVMECFAQEGWTPAGAFWGRDAMHFQATR